MSVRSSLLRTLAFVAISVGAFSTSGCATMYVDAGLQNASAADVRKPARVFDAQLLFSFRSKGTENARATDALKAQVAELVATSGLFATVGADPSLSGAILNITLDNVPITDQSDAAAKGFATGLTLGLVGSTVTDGYVCTIDYVAPGSTSKVTKTSRHAIHTTMGAKGAPANATKARNAEDAVRTMTSQIILDGLKQLSNDPVFATQVGS
jgi:hypothetical protein